MIDPERIDWDYDITTEDVLGVPARVFATRLRHAGALALEGRRRPGQAYLVEDDRRLTFAELDTLRTHLSASLAHFEVPSRWWIRSEPLPRNATGKIIKAALRSEWLTDSTAPSSTNTSG
jgi:acyl-CoA synthetase (AMP-forming)/AMP-acid ligase II